MRKALSDAYDACEDAYYRGCNGRITRNFRGRIKMRFYDFIIEKEIKESPEEVVEVNQSFSKFTWAIN